MMNLIYLTVNYLIKDSAKMMPKEIREKIKPILKNMNKYNI